jgi:serine/threonine protein kinase/Tol biopolymer transport system component
MPLSAGTRLGPYQVLAPIGAGGMGEVYRARDSRLGREVALKILPAAFASDSDRVRRFEQEGRAAAALNHPNIVVIYDAGSEGDVFYVATELLEGETLRERLAGSALPVRKAIDYAIQIARGLAAAHAKGITHRDLKPENLFITKDGLVKILDFGLAKQSGLKPPGSHPTELATQPIETNPGMVLGTAGYMSPEQVRGQTADARSDLFSLGVVLYEMVSGKRAFAGDSSVEVMNAILKQEPPDLDAALPPVLDRMIRRCLEKKPDERFQSARDLAFALESISGTTSSGIQRTAEKPRRRYAMIFALVAVACLIGLAFLVGRRTSRAPSPSFQRVTFRRGVVDNGRFANGARTIVYSASWDGNPSRVYSTQAESPESRDLGIVNGHLHGVSPADEMALGLSPDFSFVSGTLARVPISGGTPREVAVDIAAADWTSNGNGLAVVRVRPGFQQLEFPIGKVLYQTTGAVLNPRISPKGDLIAFLDEPLGATTGIGSLATVDAKGNKKTLTQFWLGTINGLAWSSSGDEILFTAAPYGFTTSLYAVNRSGRQRLVAHLSGNFAVLDVAPDGRLLMGQTIQANTILYQRSSDSNETDLYWHDFSVLFDISRDGKSLLFAEAGDATRSGEDFVTYLRGTDGSAAVRLGPGIPLQMSPDGKWALVLGSSRTPSQLVFLPTGAGEARPLTHDEIHHQGAAWTPDGKRIVFVGNEPGHGIRYNVQGLDGRPPRAITPENVSYSNTDPITISPDSKSVAVVSVDGKAALFPLDGSVPRVVPKMEGFVPLQWCSDNSLMVYHPGNPPVKIFRVDIETGDQTLWRALAPSYRTGLAAIQTIRIGADCQSSAYSAYYAPSLLWIVDGLR